MNFNQVLLIGRLTKDPVLRATSGGTPVCEAGLAVNRSYMTSNGEKKEDTLFIDVVFWNGYATAMANSGKKGMPIFVEGRLELDSWTGSDGQSRQRIRAVAESFQFLAPRAQTPTGTTSVPTESETPVETGVEA